MTQMQMLLAEIEQESQATRRCLERLSDQPLDWRPHDKSMTIGYLAHHIASTGGYVMNMLEQDSYDASNMSKAPEPESWAQVLADFDSTLASLRERLGTKDDAWAASNWRFTAGETTLMEAPRAALARMLMLNHIVHHRGQLSVYMRLLNVAVPSIYGPSADEVPEFMQKAMAAK